LLISANRHLETYQRFGCRVISDGTDDRFRGPLAGMLAALRAAPTPYVLTAPCDSPLLPPDYAARMLAALAEAGAVASVACGEGGWQPVFALLSVGLRDDLAAWLATGQGGVGCWLRRHRPVPVEFPDRPEWFRNVNTPEELARLEVEWVSLGGET
jgi:molybdopterin-guanine dinucleotide biosynthesis protein A